MTRRVAAQTHRDWSFALRFASLLMWLMAASLTALGQEPPPPRRTFTPEQSARLLDAASLAEQVGKLYEQRNFREAIRLGEKALSIREEILGKNHQDLIDLLNDLALAHEKMGNLVRGEELFSRALTLAKKHEGAETAGVASILNNLGGLRISKGDLAAAEGNLREALKIRMAVFGERHPLVAQCLTGLVALHMARDEFRKAIPLAEKSLEIAEATLGKDDVRVAAHVNNLASAYHHHGDYARAVPLYRRALDLVKKTHGENHHDYAMTLSNLGELYETQADFARAGELYRKALEIRRRIFGEEHFAIASSLSRIGGLYLVLGDSAKAEPLLRQGMEMRQRILGKDHPLVASSLHNLAIISRRQGNLEQAEAYYLESLRIKRKAFGQKSRSYAITLRDYAQILRDRDKLDLAEKFLEEALETLTEVVGENHPDIDPVLNGLAHVRAEKGDLEGATKLYLRALEILRRTAGERHPHYGIVVSNLAVHYFAIGDRENARRYFRMAAETALASRQDAALGQSPRQQLELAFHLKPLMDAYLKFALGDDAEAAHAYRYFLAFKGGILRRQQLRLATLSHPAVAAKLDELRESTKSLSRLALAVPEESQKEEWRREMRLLTDTKERLEAELAKASVEFQAAQFSPTPAQLQQALPAGTALIDFFEYEAFTPKLQDRKVSYSSEWRVAAFLVQKDQPIRLFDLAAVDPIKKGVEAWLQGLSGETAESQQAGQFLRKSLWQPFQSPLQGTKVVLISPDTTLHRLPFAALPGEQPGKFLLEEFAIGIIPVPAGLVNSPAGATPLLPPSLLAVGDVDYGKKEAGAAPPPGDALATRAAPGADALVFQALKGTGEEVLAIGRTFKSTHASSPLQRLHQAQATETAFQAAAPRYRFLHVATHGFYAPASVKSALERTVADPLRSAERFQSDQSLIGYHPDLLSGLALAGVNALPQEGDDGILTAAEVGTLDLRGVELVTLSACDSGLGVRTSGEGILGLQRAFQVAGARNVVGSLWKVDDLATKVLMTEFYRNLWQEKLPPIEALRQAQLKMLVAYDPKPGQFRAGLAAAKIDEAALAAARAKLQAGETVLPPLYWAAFVVSGNGK